MHAETVQTGHDMQAGLASLTHFLCCNCAVDFVSYNYCGLFYAQSHSDNGHVHATAPSSAHALAQARPTMSYIPLVTWKPSFKYLILDFQELLVDAIDY